MSGRAGERASDDAAHAVRSIEQFPRDFAHAVEFGDRDHLFVRGDLKDAVAGGVHDRLAGAKVLFTEFFDDFRSGGGLVSDGFAADLALEFFDDFWRES